MAGPKGNPVLGRRHWERRGSTIPRGKAAAVPDGSVDQLSAGADPTTAFGDHGLLHQQNEALIEPVANADVHHDRLAGAAANRDNARSRWPVATDAGRIEIKALI